MKDDVDDLLDEIAAIGQEQEKNSVMDIHTYKHLDELESLCGEYVESPTKTAYVRLKRKVDPDYLVRIVKYIRELEGALDESDKYI